MKCDEPCHLYGLTNDVLLVSRVYICDWKLQIIAHDPSVFVAGERYFTLCYFTGLEFQENFTGLSCLMQILG